jgi:hypothetical protein
MTHLEEIALAQLVTIAKTTAYHCDEQHGYMKGCNLPEWNPHKWVIEAMRAAVSIRNSEAENNLREELAKANEEIYTLKALMRR